MTTKSLIRAQNLISLISGSGATKPDARPQATYLTLYPYTPQTVHIQQRMLRRIITRTSSLVQQSSNALESLFTSSPTPQLAFLHNPSIEPIASRLSNNNPSISDCLWLAVPKRKVTPGKKRMKTTLQNRIKVKDHVIVDKRTGEPTLRHKLPFNWKDYLPGNTPKSS